MSEETRDVFRAPHPALWQERYASPGCDENPLKLLFIGHNPSIIAWNTGRFYGNPSNRFWRLLTESKILSPNVSTPCDDIMPDEYGMGFTDLGCVPGNNANSYRRDTMIRWRSDLWERLKSHAIRSGAEPKIIAFTGIRQWSQLFEPIQPRTKFGIQDEHLRPPGWPYVDAEVWVLPSSSGRAAYTFKERILPYHELSERLEKMG